MSGRCKCCDAVLTEEELCMKDENQDFYDTCMYCRAMYIDAIYSVDYPEGDFYQEGQRSVIRYD